MNQRYSKLCLLILLCLWVDFSIFAQQVFRGKVVNRQTQEVIPFAHIYFPEFDKGAIAGLKGDFELSVPSSAKAQTPVIISCMGFKPVQLAWSPGMDNLKVELEEQLVDLQGVEVKPEDPVALLREAARRIPENYGKDSAFQQGYYKNFTLLNGKNHRYTEAFVDIVKPPFRNHDFEDDHVGDSIQVREVRTKPTEFPDWKVGLMTPWELNVYLLSTRDVARDFDSSVQLENFLSSYYFEIEDRVLFEGRSTYKIKLEPRKNKKNGIWLGHIFLDEESLAFVKFDFRSSPKVFKKLKSDFGYLVVSNLYKVHYDDGEWREVIQYRMQDGIWIIDEVNSSKHFVVSSKPRDWDEVPIVQMLHYKTQSASKMPQGVKFEFLSNDLGRANTFFEKNYRADFWREFDLSQGVEMDEKQYGFKNSDLEAKPYVFNKLDTLKGTLTPIRTAFDVGFYHLDVEVFPEEEIIAGSSLVRFKVVEPTRRIQLDLYSRMEIDSIVYQGQSLNFAREYDAVFIDFPNMLSLESTEEVKVFFRGRPLDFEPAIPMYASFLWVNDEEGNPWIQAICQGYGASGWWPNKDHLSDEPDSARISITFPSDLKAISNGRKTEEKVLGNGKIRSSWAVSYPINNYNIILNIGKYEMISTSVEGLEGQLDVEYHYLEGHRELTEKKSSYIEPVLKTFEKYFGPYPFPRDGIKFLETPHAMEHQSAVALGMEYFRDEEKSMSQFSNADFAKSHIPGQILLHEFAHEWWGNSVSCTDNAELWIHEAFATYAEVLFIEDHYGYESGQIYLQSLKPKTVPENPVIGKFGVNHVHYNIWPMYDKGAYFLNTLRKMIADDPLWFELLREIQSKFKYQLITTSDILQLLNEKTNKDFSLVFDQYLYQTEIPKLEYYFESDGGDSTLHFRLDRNLGKVDFPVGFSVKKEGATQILPTTEWRKIQLTNVKLEDFEFEEMGWLLDFEQVKK